MDQLIGRHQGVGRLTAESAGDVAQERSRLLAVFGRPSACERFDPPGPGRYALFQNQLESLDLAGIRQMGAAAKLATEFAHRHHSTGIGVLLAKQHHGPRLPGIGQRNGVPADRITLVDQFQHVTFDLDERVLGDRLGVGKIESQPVGLNFAALLFGVVADVSVQRVVQDMGRRVSTTQRLTPIDIDRRGASIALADRPADEVTVMNGQCRMLLSIGHGEFKFLAANHARVTDLAPRFSVKR